jgi:hypothetical protein
MLEMQTAAEESLPISDELTTAARAELAAIERELQRRNYVASPVLWSEEVLHRFLWSQQRKILESVGRNRKTAVKSCHGPGKSFTAATATAWWLGTHRPGDAVVVTSAPTGRQVKAILWKEIGRAQSQGQLPGRTNQTEWYMTVPSGKEELVAFGQKPADLDPAAFQGIHALALLVIFDEACGMPKALWDAALTLMTNEECRFLAIGNPDDPTSHFAEVCKPGSGWAVHTIPVWETPHFTGEEVPQDVAARLVSWSWVEDARKNWAPRWRWSEDRLRCLPPVEIDPTDEKAITSSADPLWFAKVLAEFPALGGPQSLLQEAWIEEAQERSLKRGKPHTLGVDVGAGGDSSTVADRQGPVVRIVHEDHNPDTMQTCGRVVSLRRAAKASSKAEVEVRVDEIGIGKGIVDRSAELGENFLGVNVGQAPIDSEHFANLKAEAWWGVRERFASGDIDIDAEDHALANELASLRYKRTSSGKLQIESKQDALRRGIPSPNRAEALMLSFCIPPPEEAGKRAGLIW